MSRGYQHDYAAGRPQMYDVSERHRKAATMVAVLSRCMGEKLRDARVLNVGCSAGLIDEALAPSVGSVTGVDIDASAIAKAVSRGLPANVTLLAGDAMALEFADQSFDAVICSQVYEHVPDVERLIGEIHRVLRPGGVCYFAATNRWAVVEMHHGLPFLSWLPTGLADRYMRLAGKGDRYYERHLGYGALRRLVAGFAVRDFTGQILDDPEAFEAGYLFRGKVKRFAARLMFRFARPIFPGYIWVLERRAT
jgi:ubiquinone/menaquinone biosynthesis C-methylase UbiE